MLRFFSFASFGTGSAGLFSSDLERFFVQYDEHDGYKRLQTSLEARESKCSTAAIGRLFYLALPPSVYPQVRASARLAASSSF